jgi:hypothetical protein
MYTHLCNYARICIHIDSNNTDSSSDWSDDDNTKNNNETMINYNKNNQNINLQNNKNIIYLPDGTILVNAQKKIKPENPNNLFIRNKNEIFEGKNPDGVHWGMDHNKDRFALCIHIYVCMYMYIYICMCM